jgi:hypothetical protein
MTNTNFKLNVLTALAVIISSFGIASCGGGGAAAIPGPGAGNGVAPGTTDVNGQLIQASTQKASSTVGDGLSGILVKLISTSTGRLMGSDITDGLGKYEFKGVPSGNGYLVKVEFTSSQDLNGDGSLDEIELYFPVNLADQAVMELLQQIGVSDSDNDGQLDAIEVEFHSSDDKGNTDSNHSQHQRRNGKTSIDSNDDGSFDDSDDSFDDSDCDGLPDTSFSGGSIDDSQSGLHELEVKGLISAIDGSSITVGDKTFTLTDSTTWRIGDNRNASPSEFTVGTFVEVEGRTDGSSGWIASKVKTEDDFIGSGSGGDPGTGQGGIGGGSGIDELEFKGAIEAIDGTSITVNGQTFNITASTTWRIGDNRDASPSAFQVGMFVEITGDLVGDVWNARKVKIEDSVGDDGSDDSSDDGVGDDGSEDSSDDGVGDDGSDDSSDDGVGDDGSDDSSDDGNDDGSDDDDGDDDNSGKDDDDN